MTKIVFGKIKTKDFGRQKTTPIWVGMAVWKYRASDFHIFMNLMHGAEIQIDHNFFNHIFMSHES